MNIITRYLLLNNKESYKCTNIFVVINRHASLKLFVWVKTYQEDYFRLFYSLNVQQNWPK